MFSIVIHKLTKFVMVDVAKLVYLVNFLLVLRIILVVPHIGVFTQLQ